MPSAMTETEIAVIGQEQDNVEAIQDTCWSTAKEVAINAELARLMKAEVSIIVLLGVLKSTPSS